ncbi:MAG TPA: hypothetical protein EYG11_12030 [Candidatus Latescibacteria bacterium]|nr:hypothetical protein [Candidatus Handelsmanbacteria bacterium]HIL09422.1 hypothetical protein [Candidatus Latescibacterota bacterium]
MIWFFGVLTIALLAVLAQILLLTQKRSNEFKIRQDPLRRRIEFHHSEMEGSFSRVEDTVVRRQEEITFTINHLKKQREALGQAVAQLQNQVYDDQPELVDSDAEAVMVEVAAAAGEQSPRTVLREAQNRYEEIGGYIGELEKDVTNVRRNIERIEVKMRWKTSVELQEAGEAGESGEEQK